MVAHQPLHLLVSTLGLTRQDSSEIDARSHAKNVAIRRDSQQKQQIRRCSALSTSSTSTASTCSTSLSSSSSKSVQFNGTVRVRTTLHIDDYTDEEYEQCWLNAEEVAAIKAENAETVALANTGDDINQLLQQQGLSMRGLEGRTTKGTRRRHDNKYAGLTAVMDEQDRQVDEEDQEDHEAIREVFVRVNRHCSSDSYAMGLRDQIEALRIYMEDDRDGEGSEARRQHVKQFIKKTLQLRKDVLEQARQLRKDGMPQPQPQQQQQQPVKST